MPKITENAKNHQKCKKSPTILIVEYQRFDNFGDFWHFWWFLAFLVIFGIFSDFWHFRWFMAFLVIFWHICWFSAFSVIFGIFGIIIINLYRNTIEFGKPWVWRSSSSSSRTQTGILWGWDCCLFWSKWGAISECNHLCNA